MLPTKERTEKHVDNNVFKYWKETSQFFEKELSIPSRDTNKTRSHMASEIPLRKSNSGEKKISFMGPSNWNKLRKNLKFLSTTTLFTYSSGKLILKNLND